MNEVGLYQISHYFNEIFSKHIYFYTYTYLTILYYIEHKQFYSHNNIGITFIYKLHTYGKLEETTWWILYMQYRELIKCLNTCNLSKHFALIKLLLVSLQKFCSYFTYHTVVLKYVSLMQGYRKNLLIYICFNL